MSQDISSYLQKVTPASENTVGSIMALVEIVRLLNNIDKKLYVVIKKLEEKPYEEDKEPTAEDLGYDGDDQEPD